MADEEEGEKEVAGKTPVPAAAVDWSLALPVAKLVLVPLSILLTMVLVAPGVGRFSVASAAFAFTPLTPLT